MKTKLVSMVSILIVTLLAVCISCDNPWVIENTNVLFNEGPIPMSWITVAGIVSPGFQMGSPVGEPGRDSDETQHAVELTGFMMSKYEVTQAQWQAVMGTTIQQLQAATTDTGNYGRGDNYPMYFVSWYDALVFCNKLSMKEGLSPAYQMIISSIPYTDPDDWIALTGGSIPTGNDGTWNGVTIILGSTGYRLPTEAQWEYACRAGTVTPFNTGNNITTDQANYDGRSPYNGNPAGIYRAATTPVGTFPANAWSLYDMHGNVFEWCWDRYEVAPAGGTDPTGATTGTNRVIRGGSWVDWAKDVRSAYRHSNGPWGRASRQGFRIVRP